MASRHVLKSADRFRVWMFINNLKEKEPKRFPMDMKNLVSLVASGVGISISDRSLRTLITDSGMDKSQILRESTTGTPMSQLHNRVTLLMSNVQSLEARLAALETSLGVSHPTKPSNGKPQ